MSRTALYSCAGSPLHARLCEAFLNWGGYLNIDDDLHEILGAVHEPDVDAWRWELRPRVAIGGHYTWVHTDIVVRRC